MKNDSRNITENGINKTEKDYSCYSKFIIKKTGINDWNITRKNTYPVHREKDILATADIKTPKEV